MHKRRTGGLAHLKVLTVSFAVIFAAVLGLVLPVVLNGKAAASPPDNLLGADAKQGTDGRNDNPADNLNEPSFEYVTAFFFKEGHFEVPHNAQSLTHLVVAEKGGVTNFKAITGARAETADGNSKSVDVQVNPFVMKVIGTGECRVFLKATQIDGTERTISASIVVKDYNKVPANGEDTASEPVTKPVDSHTVVYEYITKSGKIIIKYFINGISQQNSVFDVSSVQDNDYIGKQYVGNAYRFYPEGDWELVVRHSETGQETVIKSL